MMTAPEIDLEEIEQTGLALYEMGYPLVPIAKGLKHPNMSGWSDAEPTKAQIISWARSGKYWGWGVLAKFIGGLDVDVYDKTLSQVVHDYIQKHNPALSIVRYGQKPKHLFPFLNTEQWTKRTSASYIDPADPVHLTGDKQGKPKAQRIEVLGDGQQWVCSGIHKDTELPYKYTGASLLTVPPTSLPKLQDPEFLDDIFEYFERQASARGWTQHASRDSDTATVTPISDVEAYVKAKSPGNWTKEQIIADLKLISATCPRDKWVQVGMAIHHQFQGDPAGFDIFHQWSRTGDNYASEQDCLVRWDSFHTDGSRNSTTFATVHMWAEEARSETREADRKEEQKRANAARKIFRLGSLQGKAPPVDWVWDMYVPARETTLLYADGGIGKTMLAMQLGACIVAGEPFMGRDTSKGPVLFISCEDDQQDIHRRLELIEDNMMISRTALNDFVVTTTEEGESFSSLLMEFEKDTGKKTEFFRWIEGLADQIKPRCVFVDTAADTFGGNEIIKSQVRQFVRSLTSLARRANAAVFMLAHPSQSGMSTGTGTSGNVGWNNSARSRLYMFHNNPDNPADPTLTFKHMKANKGPKEPDLTLINANGFMRNLTPEEVDAITHIELAQTQFMELLARVIEDGDSVGPSANGGDRYAPARFVRLQNHYRQMTSFSREQYADAMDALRIDNRIEIVEHGNNRRRDIRPVQQNQPQQEN